jgi:hypothetical protein
MSLFEYVMIPPAIVLGLALTHVLAGAGRVVHRLAGHGAPVRIDWIHLTWVAHIFSWIVLFWWYSYAWTTTFEWSMLIFVFLVLYAVAMYVMCVVLVPSDMDQVEDFATYFMSLRSWFFSGLIGLILIDVLDTAAKGLDHLLDIGPGYATMRTFILVGSIIAMRNGAAGLPRTFRGRLVRLDGHLLLGIPAGDIRRMRCRTG